MLEDSSCVVAVSRVCLITCLLFGNSIIAVDPEIVNEIQNLTKSINERADLDCSVKNKGTRKLYWQQEFNSALVQLTTDETILINNPVGGTFPDNTRKYEIAVTHNTDSTITYRLTIHRLGELDVGVYVCSLVQLSSTTQPPISKRGSITVRGIVTGDPIIVNTIGIVNGTVNESATLSCLVANKGSHPVKWRRLRDNIDISLDTSVIRQNPVVDGVKKFSIVRKSFNSGLQFELTVNRLSVDDGGQYQCQVATATKSGTLFIQVPPVISSPTPENVSLALGGIANLTCAATGAPTPPVVWQRDDFKHLPTGGQTYKGPTIHITNVKKEQRGLYVCRAANGVYPDAERTFRVIVTFPPSAVASQNNASQALGFPVVIQCILEGYPEVTPSWNKVIGGSRTPINPSSGYIITNTKGNGVTGPINYSQFSLRIERVTETDYGQYECEGKSTSASASAGITLTKSAMCVGSVCPVTTYTANPVTDPHDKTTCKGDNCTGGSNRLQIQSMCVVLTTIVCSVFKFHTS